MSDPHWGSVSLLLPFDVDFTDAGPSGTVVTPNSNAAISSAQSKFGGGSLALDGNGDYITIPNAAGIAGTGDFTLEFWLYVSVLPTDPNKPALVYDCRPSATNGPYLSMALLNTGVLNVFVNSAATSSTGAGAITAGTWYHAAISRSAGTSGFFVDGALIGSWADATDYQIGPLGTRVGAGTVVAPGNGFDLAGYIDDLRITQGVARYTVAFTPPTAAFPTAGPETITAQIPSPIGAPAAVVGTPSALLAVIPPPIGSPSSTATVDNPLGAIAQIPSPIGAPQAAGTAPWANLGDPLYGFVTLALPFDGADGATATTDGSGDARAVSFAGSAEIDTAQSKWGGSSLRIPSMTGGSAVTVANSTGLLDLSGDFSVQCWYYPDATADGAGYGYLWNAWDDIAGDGIEVLLLESDAFGVGVRVYVYDSIGSEVASILMSLADYVSKESWHYIDVTRSGNTLYLFVDGALVGSEAISGTPSSSAAVLSIGGSIDGHGDAVGWIDDFRISNGVARNTTAYTAPTSAHRLEQGSEGAFGSVPSPIARFSSLLINDFAALVTDPTARYVCRLTGDPIVEVPISSWQATVQSDLSSFLQAVIPAAGDWVDILTDRQGAQEIVVYRQTTINGLTMESEMARASIDTVALDQGPTRYTATVRGYTDAFSSPVSSTIVALNGVRSTSQSIGGSVRIRADIDWNLRPGQTVSAGNLSFEVGYINYYVPAVGDSYMDAGSRG